VTCPGCGALARKQSNVPVPVQKLQGSSDLSGYVSEVGGPYSLYLQPFPRLSRKQSERTSTYLVQKLQGSSDLSGYVSEVGGPYSL
jgi:hypothetical protein